MLHIALSSAESGTKFLEEFVRWVWVDMEFSEEFGKRFREIVFDEGFSTGISEENGKGSGGEFVPS